MRMGVFLAQLWQLELLWMMLWTKAVTRIILILRYIICTLFLIIEFVCFGGFKTLHSSLKHIYVFDQDFSFQGILQFVTCIPIQWMSLSRHSGALGHMHQYLEHKCGQMKRKIT